MRRRLAAILALVAAAATLAFAIGVAISQFPRALILPGCVVIAGLSAWYGLRRRGIARVAGLIVAALALAGTVALIVVGGAPLVDLLVVAGLLVSLAALSAASTIHVDLPSATAPRNPVLFFWPVGTARKLLSPRSPPSSACRTPVCLPGPATTSRSISALTATMSSAPSMRSSTAVSGS